MKKFVGYAAPCDFEKGCFRTPKCVANYGYLSETGYLQISLRDNNGTLLREKAHRAVWKAKMGVEIPKGLVIMHKNDIRTDNRFENLALGTYSQNNYAIKRTNYPKGLYKKIPVVLTSLDGKTNRSFESMAACERATGVCRSTLGKVLDVTRSKNRYYKYATDKDGVKYVVSRA